MVRRVLSFVLILTAVAFAQTRPVPVPAQKPADEAARKVFFIDASTNAAKHLDALRTETKRSITELDLNQQFNIVLLRAGKLTTFRPRLAAATEKEKAAAVAFLDGLKAEGQPSLLPLADYLTHGDADVCFALLFDGMKDIEKTAQRIEDEYKGKANINIIRVTSEKQPADLKLLTSLSRRSGGMVNIIPADQF